MNPPVEAVTTAALSLALEAASRRHQAISANIANLGSQGQVPLKLDFESQLLEARASLREQGRIDPQALADVRLDIEPAFDAQGRPVKLDVDEQMVDMARNAVHFQALAQGLSRHLGILALAAHDGRK